MQLENRQIKNKIDRPSSIVWLTAFILAVLVVATISVVGTCIYNYAHRSDCQISLYDGQIKEKTSTIKNAVSQQKTDSVLKSQATQYSGAKATQQSQKSAFEVSDTEKLWKTETAVELFKSEYQNAEGAVTVKSIDGSHVVAPGTEGSYTFSLKNTSSDAAQYKIWMETDLSSNMTGVPLQARMSSENGWLLGSKNSWESAQSLSSVTTEEKIAAGRTAEYTIYWRWPFEREDDKEDTDFGNDSVNQEMSYKVTIYTLTTAATEQSSQEDTDDQDTQKNTEAQNHQSQKQSRKAAKTGDSTNILQWVIVLAIAAGVLFCLFIVKKRKNDTENEQNESEQRKE